MQQALFRHEHPRRLKSVAIGCGSHAMRNVLPALAFAPVDLAAVCDLDAGRAEAAARMFGAERTYTNHQEMLERERPEAAFVVLNYDDEGKPRYPKVVADVLAAGAHVWIEKPPAASVEEIEGMALASEKAGRNVGVGFKKMFAPANRKAREIVGRPEFGKTHTITARYPQPLPPHEERADDRRMVGFLDHVVHPFSVLRLLGGPISGIRVEREPRSGASFTTVRFAGGALGCLHLTAGGLANAPLERTEIVGEGGMVVVDNNIRVTYYRSGPSAGPYGRAANYFGADDGAALTWEPEFSLGQLYNKGLFLLGYAPEIVDFCERSISGQPLEHGSLDDALDLMRVYEAYRQPDGTDVCWEASRR
jgi:predicted dehydrogenase